MWSFAGKVMILGGNVRMSEKSGEIEIIDVDDFSFTCPANPIFTPYSGRFQYFGSGLVPFGTDSRPLVCGGTAGSNCQYLDNR